MDITQHAPLCSFIFFKEDFSSHNTDISRCFLHLIFALGITIHLWAVGALVGRGEGGIGQRRKRRGRAASPPAGSVPSSAGPPCEIHGLPPRGVEFPFIRLPGSEGTAALPVYTGKNQHPSN